MKTILFVLTLISAVLSSAMQEACDTVLFSISLTADTSSLYGCKWDDQVRSTLAGPVMMKKGLLLLYSQNGYVLYNQNGKLMDSHSLFKMNRKAARNKEGLMKLAYPLDSSAILYYREIKKNGKRDVEIFQKGLFSGKMTKVTGALYENCRNIASSQLFNLANNSITDEMGRRSYLKQHLVGYTSIDKGMNWWTIDKLFSITSPIIVENNKKFEGFFPGLRSDQEPGIKTHLIEPLGVFKTGGRWYYYSLYTPMGNTYDEYLQTLLLCDQAGNLLYTNKIPKQEITDAVLQKVDKINTEFTVRKAARYVFVPSVDRFGDIYYGMIDFERRKIDIHKRMFFKFIPQNSPPIFPLEFEREEMLSCSPVFLECRSVAGRGVVPEIAKTKHDGSIEMIEAKDQQVGDYFVRIHRSTNSDLKKHLKRVQHSLPDYVRSMQDSLASLSSLWCPYGISLNHKDKGQLSYFNYGAGDSVLCARVLQVTLDSEVFVRIDCEHHAEILQFNAAGDYMNRFTFNNQFFKTRKDIVIITEQSEIAERNYESQSRGFQHVQWVRAQSAGSHKK